jgi:hypothetical protein
MSKILAALGLAPVGADAGYDWNNGYGWGGPLRLERLARRSGLPPRASPLAPAP